VLTQTVLSEHVDGVRIQLAGGVSWHVEVADNDKSGADDDDDEKKMTSTTKNTFVGCTKSASQVI